MIKNLNQRERFLVFVGVPLVLLTGFYLYLWQPAYQEMQRLRVDVPEQRATLAWMQHQLTTYSGGGGGQPVDQRPLLTVIEKMAIAAHIQKTIQRVQPGNDRTVEVWLQEVVADQLFEWIDQLAVRGITVDSATITRGTPGLVSARIRLSR